MCQTQRSEIWIWALSGLFALTVGCGGGGGADPSVFIDWQTSAVDIDGQITLPATSPIALSELRVDVYDFSAPADENGKVALKIPDNQIVEAYIMLPERDGDTLPTIFFYTTVLPGETDVQFSAEETAVSLLIGRINHDTLLAAGTPVQVKEIIREHGAAFVTEFSAAQGENPYLLNQRYLNVLYTAEFESSADRCRSALVAAASALSSSAQKFNLLLVSGSQMYVRPEPTQYDFTVYEETTGMLGLGSWLDLEDAGGIMTGHLKIENDTMLFAHFIVSDLLTGSEMKSLAFDDSIHGYIAAAFHPDLLGPQKGWNRLWWAGSAKTDADFKSTKVVLYTPKIATSDVATELERVIGGGLAFRTGATALMNVVSNFAPLNEDGWKHWFVEMYDRGLLTAALDKFAYGDIKGGVEEIFWTFSDGTVMESFLKDYLGKYIKNQLESKKITAQLLNKFNQVTKLIPIGKIGLAIDVAKLVDDVVLTPGKITFDRVEFPLNLADAAPSVIHKVGPADPLPVITITGMGLAPVFFDGEAHMPSVFLEAKDARGKSITKVIRDEDVSVSGGGESLWFELPRDWAEMGGDVRGPLQLNVAHRFVDTHGIEELVYLTLPRKGHESLFALGLGTEVVIAALSESNPVRGMEITLFGEGFSTISSQNHVYFTDHQGLAARARVEMATATLLDVVVPASLAFGPLTVHVELDDGSESNRYGLSLHPKSVNASPADGTHFVNSQSVSLTQSEGVDIFYRVGGGPEMAYAKALQLTDTATVYPFARVKVDGVDYASAIGSFFYYKCAADEKLVKGVCVDNSPSGQAWKLIESNPLITCSSGYTNYSHGPGAWSISIVSKVAGEGEVLRVNGSYTPVPAWLKPNVEVPFSASVEVAVVDEDRVYLELYETIVWAMTYSEYPLNNEGRNEYTLTPSLNQGVVRARNSGAESGSETGTLSLPAKGWSGWAKYVLLTTSGGTAKPISGCDLRYNHVYLWQD